MRGTPLSERVVVLTTVKMRRDLEKIAAVKRTSLNQVILAAIDKYLEEHQNDIDRYNAFFGEVDSE